MGKKYPGSKGREHTSAQKKVETPKELIPVTRAEQQGEKLQKQLDAACQKAKK
ncbi:hypothetical protein PM082_024218 [Marasmius tenuissimus]|nr:hypothetical protein PM082_024218 [Marasmius tenuissimus]